MAIQTTLVDYRQRFYDRFDEGQSTYIDNAQANRLINEARAHLHNWIVVSNEDYMVSEYVFTVVANQADYALPVDFFKDLKVFGYYSQPSSPQPYYWPLPRRMRGEYRGGSANIYRYPTANVGFGYMILGNVLRLDPMPASGGSVGIKMWYAPHYTPLVNDSDVENAAWVPGWDEYVVNQAVIGAKIKEESDVGAIMGRQAEIKQLIEQDMMNRDMGQPGHVIDMERGNGMLGYTAGGRGY
jgi:hypothetical protein